jgi:2-polyprenyl-3-methyl-5-hydroxy-6-metoxy-1,4-benzoquinol methylase
MQEIEKMLEVNREQAKFYNHSERKDNAATRIWGSLRENTLGAYRRSSDISKDAYAFHTEWLGDLSDKKVLDLGCLRGNRLSIYMATHAKRYIGIDLSTEGIAILNDKLKAANAPASATAITMDFLSPEFDEKDFDIVYAYGVMHHFEFFEAFLEKIKEKLKPGGRVISYDPTETSWPIYLFRRIYRPFQSDADWEWPFSRNTYKMIQKHFKVLQVQGFLGASKWGVIPYMLPFLSAKKKQEITNKLHQKDLRLANKFDGNLYKCMHVIMHLQKKD